MRPNCWSTCAAACAAESSNAGAAVMVCRSATLLLGAAERLCPAEGDAAMVRFAATCGGLFGGVLFAFLPVRARWLASM